MAQFDDDPDDTYIDPAAALATLMALGAIADQWNSIRTARDRGLPAHLADELERGFLTVAGGYLGVAPAADVPDAPDAPKRTPEDARHHPIPGDQYVFGDGSVWTVTEVEDEIVHYTQSQSADWCTLRTWAGEGGFDDVWVPA